MKRESFLKRCFYFVGVPIFNIHVASKRARWDLAASRVHVKLMESERYLEPDSQRFVDKCKQCADQIRAQRLDVEWCDTLGIRTFSEFEQFKDFIRVDLEHFADWWNGDRSKKVNPHLPEYLPWP